jgi:hypothetical protein
VRIVSRAKSGLTLVRKPPASLRGAWGASRYAACGCLVSTASGATAVRIVCSSHRAMIAADFPRGPRGGGPAGRRSAYAVSFCCESVAVVAGRSCIASERELATTCPVSSRFHSARSGLATLWFLPGGQRGPGRSRGCEAQSADVERSRRAFASANSASVNVPFACSSPSLAKPAITSSAGPTDDGAAGVGAGPSAASAAFV